MFAYVGRSNQDIAALHKALKESARNDVIAREFKSEGHCVDGWGYVMLSQSGLFHYRNGKPIFDDEHELPRLDGKVYAIFHARRASDKHKLGTVFAHPFPGSLSEHAIYLAHNGLVDMGDLSGADMTDTEYALRVITRKGLTAGIEELKDLTLTGLNLLILEIDKQTQAPAIRYLNFYVNPHRSRYFDMHFAEMADGKAIVSSTLLKYGIKRDTVLGVPFDRLSDLEEF